MQTKILRLNPEDYDSEILTEPAHCISMGGLVAIPTETVYGIAVDYDNPSAISRLLEVRNSPKEKLLTIHIASQDALSKYPLKNIPNIAKRLMKKFWPGPLTIVLPTEDSQGLGFRYPNNKIACDLIGRSSVNIAMPSANISGKPPAFNAEQVIEYFDGKIDYIIDGGETRYKMSSTVVKAFGPRLEILREGAIPKSVIDEFVYVTILFVCTGNTCRSPIAEIIFKKMLAKKYGLREDELEQHGFRILSAGTAGGFGIGTIATVRMAMAEAGYDITLHSSQPLTYSLIDEADFIYVMTREHKETIKEWSVDSADKVFLLDPDNEEIEDHAGGPLEMYRECISRIRRCLEKRIAEF